MKCPKCSEGLKREVYEGIAIDRCSNCQGTWLDEGELASIINSRQEKFTQELTQELLTTAFAGIPNDEKRSIEKCPKCSMVMTAVNYEYNSGVVIDRCPDSHGVWLDGKELEKIQAHREHWEREAEKHEHEWLDFALSVQKAKDLEKDEKNRTEMRPTKYLVNSMIKKLLGI